MYVLGQRIFEIQIDSKFNKGVLFGVRELEVVGIEDVNSFGGNLNGIYELSNQDGSYREKVSSHTMRKLLSNKYQVDFSHNFYADSFSEMEQTLEGCWDHLQQVYSEYISVLNEDLKLLNLSLEKYLNAKGVSYDRVMERIEFAVGEEGEETKLEGWGELYLSFEYFVRSKLRDKFDIKVARIDVLPKDRMEATRTGHSHFISQMEDEDLYDLIDSSFEQEGTLVATIYEFHPNSNEICDEETLLIPNDLNNIILHKEYNPDFHLFLRCHYIPCKANMTEDEFYGACRSFLEAVKDNLIPFIRFMREAEEEFSKEFSYSSVEQVYFD